MNKADIARKYLQKGNYKAALAKLSDWVHKYPTDRDAWLDLGACHYHMSNIETGLMCTKKSYELDNNFPLAYNNIGLYYQMINDGATAVKWYKKASDAGYHDANFNLALSMLRELMDNISYGEKWNSAWEMYSWRFKKSSPVPLPTIPSEMKMWDGSNNPVMVVTEQGVGDTIMFDRYLGYMPSGSVYAIPVELNPILKHRKTCNTTNDSGCSYYIPAGDMPKWFGAIPSIERVKTGGSKIGVCWQGNTDHANDRNRSYPGLKKKMLELGVSLQYGHNPEIKSWEDTLRILDDCHTVVTVDTSIAHVAGFLGIRTLVLMPKLDWDFRWGTGKTNHWYPTITAYSTWDELLKDL